MNVSLRFILSVNSSIATIACHTLRVDIFANLDFRTNEAFNIEIDLQRNQPHHREME